MKVWITENEWYPVYEIDTEPDYSDLIEVDEKLIEAFKLAKENFDEIQFKLASLKKEHYASKV